MPDISLINTTQKTRLNFSNPIGFKIEDKHAVSYEGKPLEDNEAAIREQIFLTKIKIKKCVIRLEELGYLIDNLSLDKDLASDGLFPVDSFNKKLEEYKRFRQYNREYDNVDTYMEKLDIFLKHLEKHPKTAFLYNPDISDEEKREILSKTDNLRTTPELSAKLNIPAHTITDCIRGKVIEADCAFDRFLIDMDYAPNQEFFAKAKENILTNADFCSKYNYTQAELRKLLKSGELISSSGSVYVIDIQNEQNAKTIREHLKTTPVKSPKYYKSNVSKYEKMVPISYLSSLGFGTPVQLFSAVKNNELAGKYIIKNTPEGKKYNAVVDISPIWCEYALQRKRDNNESVKTIEELAQMLNLSVIDIKKALIDDELEIIPEFIFAADSSSTFIDLTKQKNIDYINKYKP